MHACLSTLPDGSMMLDDLNSTNGTFVNGKRITTCILSENDDVLISNKYPLDWKKYKKLDKKDAVEDVVDAENPNMAIISKSKVITFRCSYFLKSFLILPKLKSFNMNFFIHLDTNCRNSFYSL